MRHRAFHNNVIRNGGTKNGTRDLQTLSLHGLALPRHAIDKHLNVHGFDITYLHTPKSGDHMILQVTHESSVAISPDLRLLVHARPQVRVFFKRGRCTDVDADTHFQLSLRDLLLQFGLRTSADIQPLPRWRGDVRRGTFCHFLFSCHSDFLLAFLSQVR